MFSDVIVIHRPGGQGHATLSETLSSNGLASVRAEQPWFLWQTCLRQIAIGDEQSLELVRPHLRPGDEVRRGDVAFKFILQIICGLHSPLVGETEVSGQFKNAVAAYDCPQSPWGLRLKRFFRALFEDAKSVRQAHLVDLGSQSYGSVLRRELKGLKRIHFVGSGQLVQEILPWIAKDGNEVHLHVRDVAKVREKLGNMKGLLIHPLRVDQVEADQAFAGADAVVIAAPVDATRLNAWFKAADETLKVVADLRADSATDLVQVAGARHLVLADVFAYISKNQALLEERKAAALAAIEVAVQERNAHVEYRPFGWEDVCA
jgi:glutamyl-tRNA reductase